MREQTGKKRFLRMIAFGLVFILLSEAIPAAAAADLLRSALREDSYINSAENGVIPAEITEEPSEAAASEPYVLGEDESLRAGLFCVSRPPPERRRGGRARKTQRKRGRLSEEKYCSRNVPGTVGEYGSGIRCKRHFRQGKYYNPESRRRLPLFFYDQA